METTSHGPGDPWRRGPSPRSTPARPTTSLLGVLLLVLGLATPKSLAADPEPNSLEPAGSGVEAGFEDTSRVVAVEVPVHVTDRQGDPIRDLEASDFVVYDDRVAQELTDFEIVDLDQLEVRSFEARRAREQLPAAGRRHILLLFDLAFSPPGALLRAREAARRWVLESLHPTDLAAVVVDSLETGPQIILTFTPDRAQLARAIETLGDPRFLAVERPDPLRFVIDNPESATEGLALLDGLTTGEGGVAEGSVLETLYLVGLEIEKSQRSYERSRIMSWANALDDLARALASIEGRKQVILFSQGFDGTLLFGQTQAPEDPNVQRQSLDQESGRLWAVDSDTVYGNSQLKGRIDRLLETFRRADCVIQAVDISGLSASEGAERRQESVGRDALFHLARSTGGELYQNANDLSRQLESALRRSSVTYLLTFERSDLEADGAYHRLEVKLEPRRRGAQISHRAGYFAPRRFDTLHPIERELLAASAIANAEPRNELPIHLLAPAFRNGGGAYVPLIVEIPGESLLAPGDDTPLSLELYAYATDSKGTMRDFFTQQIQLDAATHRATLTQSGVKVYAHLDLGVGDHLVRLLLRDSRDGRVGVVARQVEVPVWRAGAPHLLPPLAIEPPGRWILVRRDEPGGGDGVIYPFVVEGTPFVPGVLPRLGPAETWRIALVAYNLGDGAPDFTGRVLDAAGVAVDGDHFGDLERTPSTSDVAKLVVPFTADALAPGAYTVELTVVDPASGQPLVQTLEVVVEES